MHNPFRGGFGPMGVTGRVGVAGGVGTLAGVGDPWHPGLAGVVPHMWNTASTVPFLGMFWSAGGSWVLSVVVATSGAVSGLGLEPGGHNDFHRYLLESTVCC